MRDIILLAAFFIMYRFQKNEREKGFQSYINIPRIQVNKSKLFNRSLY